MENRNKKEEKRIKLELMHAFGSSCSKGMKNSVTILDEDGRKIIYPVGKFIAIK